MSDTSAHPVRRPPAERREVFLAPAPAVSSPRLRLEVLDAVRGLAALAVVFFHIRVLVDPVTRNLSSPFRLLAALTNHGHDAVVVFIVLSGFVLTLPLAKSGGATMPGGLPQYFRRRARRILPTYFAALIIFLLLGLMWVMVSQATGQRYLQVYDNPFVDVHATLGALLSHAVMIFNFHRPWAMAVDSPMWSVATEWQIYFLFPLVLLPLWRHAGLLAAVIGGFAVGLIPVFVSPASPSFETWCPWMLGDFALGMTAAAIAFAPEQKRLSRGLGIWGAGCGVVVAAMVLMQIGLPQQWHAMDSWQKDAMMGTAVAFLLVYLARCQTGCLRPPLVFRLLDTRAAIALGSFSYSLYLVHFPVLSLLNVVVSRFAPGPRAYVVAMYLLGTLLSLTCGYSFYRVFERPFCRPKSSRPAPAGISLNHSA